MGRVIHKVCIIKRHIPEQQLKRKELKMSIKHKYYRLEVASYQDIDTKAINENFKKSLGNVQSIIWNLTEEETVSYTSKYYKGLHVPVPPKKEWTWMLKHGTCSATYTNHCAIAICDMCIYCSHNYKQRAEFYIETFKEKPEKIDTEAKTEDSVFVIHYPKSNTIEMFKSWDGLEKRVRTHLKIKGIIIATVVDSTTDNTLKALEVPEFLDYSSVCKSLDRPAGVRIYYGIYSKAYNTRDYISIYKMPLKA